MARLSGLRVLVTGGGSGIGRTIAVRLAQEGARVHVCDVSAEALADLSATCPGLGGTCADVGNEADVDRLFADARCSRGAVQLRRQGLPVRPPLSLRSDTSRVGPRAASNARGGLTGFRVVVRQREK